jgi:uncharacterized membrane protein
VYVILALIFLNHVVTFVGNSWTGLLDGKGFDPAPFILLNLVFSAVAFYTGALVIIAQKAQTRTDRANEMAGARHREELIQNQSDLLQKEHRSLRADLRPGHEDDRRPDRASPRRHLRAPSTSPRARIRCRRERQGFRRERPMRQPGLCNRARFGW